MGKVLLIILLIMAIPWAISTWWQIRRSTSPRERSFISRTSLGVWMLTIGAAIVVGMLSLRGQIIALPMLVIFGFAIRHGLKKARARILAEEGDPLARARRLN